MKDLKNISQLELDQELIEKLIEADYAFAVWKMPGQKEIQLIISLNGAQQLEDFSLIKCDIGFIVNSYEANHPVNPYFIPADILIKEQTYDVNPKVKDISIDTLIENLNQKLEVRKPNPQVISKGNNNFEIKVAQAIRKIKAGVFDKVVLSRFKDEKLPDGFSAWKFFEKICESYPNAFCNLYHIPDKGLWIGATPETLISDNPERFITVSLAGTKSLSENNDLSEIAWTQKEIEEQAFVSRYVINCFKKIRLREFHEHGPKTIQAGNLAHLKTEFKVDYDEVSFEGLADQMLELLHPTSAVCGMPIEQTKPWIKHIEDYDREFYAGFIGPVNFDNSTDIFVNLRCMKIFENVVRFYAGAGITEDSSPSKEFEETEMKMNVLKSLIF